MSIWLEVINHVRLRYEVLEESDSWLRFRLNTEGNRDHQVSVHYMRGPDGAELIEISSPVGWADKVDLRRLLELAGTVMIGGAAVVDGVALIKHAVPLADLSIQDEFERPLLQVVAHADAFERELTGTDHF